MAKSILFSIPYVNELLSSPRIKPFLERLHPASVFATMRGVMDDISGEMMSAATERRMPDVTEMVEKIVARLQDVEQQGVSVLLDARGILFSQKRNQFALSVVEDMVWSIDSNCNMEESVVSELICRLTGAEDAIVFESPTVAKLAVLTAFCRKNPVVIGHRDLYEDHTGKRLESILRFAGVRMRKVGAVNRVTYEDYASAIQRRAGLVYMATGRHSELQQPLVSEALTHLLELSEQKILPVLLDAEFAPIINMSPFFLKPVPSVTDYLKEGYSLVLFSGGQLVGGPECGIIAGKKDYVSKLRQQRISELFPVHRVDLAGLYKTLSLSLDPEKAMMDIPILQTVSTSLANLRNRASRLIPQLEAIPVVESVEMTEGISKLYPETNDGILPGCILRIVPHGKKAEELAKALTRMNPGLFVNVVDNLVSLDLRTILPMYDSVLVDIFESCFSTKSDVKHLP